VALGAGVWFLYAVARSAIADDPRVDYGVFKVSIAYLFLLFGAMLADCALAPLAELAARLA
jgi:heme O synthase-like polyprenyltransferase